MSFPSCNELPLGLLLRFLGSAWGWLLNGVFSWLTSPWSRDIYMFSPASLAPTWFARAAASGEGFWLFLCGLLTCSARSTELHLDHPLWFGTTVIISTNSDLISFTPA